MPKPAEEPIDIEEIIAKINTILFWFRQRKLEEYKDEEKCKVENNT